MSRATQPISPETLPAGSTDDPAKSFSKLPVEAKKRMAPNVPAAGTALSKPKKTGMMGRIRQFGWLKSSLEIIRFGTNQLKEDRAEQMAAALAFRTIFGLVPVTVIGLLIFHMFGGVERFGSFIHQILASAQLDTVQLPPADGSDKPQLLADWLAKFISTIDSSVSFESIGIVGVLLLGWAAIRLMTTIERSFNTIARADQNRSLMKRVPLYWMTLTVGPALLYLSFFVNSKFSDMVTALLQNVDKVSAGLKIGAGLVGLAGILISLGSTWLFVLLLYMFVPNTRLKLGPAAIGALVAATFWSLGAKALGGYISTAFGAGNNYNYKILYGSLGLIPVFLLWVYLMWVVILFGLEVASMCQTYKGKKLSLIAEDMLRIERLREPAMFDPDWVIVLMKHVANRFARGESTTARHVARDTGLDQRVAQRLLQSLCKSRFINEVVPAGTSRLIENDADSGNDIGRSGRATDSHPENAGSGDGDADTDEDSEAVEEVRYVLARPADRIRAVDLLEHAHSRARSAKTETIDNPPDSAVSPAAGGTSTMNDGTGWSSVEQLREARIQLLGSKTLADL